MKKPIFLLLFFIGIFLISCNKKDDNPAPANNNTNGTNITVDTSQLFSKTWVHIETPTTDYTYTYKYVFYTNHSFDETTISNHPDSFNPGQFISDTTVLHGTFSFDGLDLGTVIIQLNYVGGASKPLGQIEDISLNELHVSGNIYYKE